MNTSDKALTQHPAWQSWPIVLGLLALYVPTYRSFAQSYWPGEENAHGPIVLAVVIWLAWKLRANLFEKVEKTNPLSGFVLLTFGLLLYVVGRSQSIFMFEAGSEIPLLLGMLLITHGAGIAKKYWYPLLFLIFLIPLPESLMENLTGPLKQHVSVLAEDILYDLGYPIARNGVMLSIGPYQLLVADACSGLYSMFSLSALGLFYIYVARRPGWIHNSILLGSIIPIAFFSNVVRVVLLVLITYYFGYEVGEGFAHKTAGVVLFIAALSLFLLLDGSIIQFQRFFAGKRR